MYKYFNKMRIFKLLYYLYFFVLDYLVLNEFKISAVVPTKNRSSDLLILLDSVITQNFLPYELIIVDQSDKSNFTKTRKN